MVSYGDDIQDRYHINYIHNIMGDFFGHSLEYFSTKVYQDFKYSFISTYDKGVEHIRRIHRENNVELKTLDEPALLLDPSGDFNLSDNPISKMLYKFPRYTANDGLFLRMCTPIYRDDRITVNVGCTRLQGEFTLIALLRSTYEYFDYRINMLQVTTGEQRKFYPFIMDAFIILPEELINYQYSNAVANLSYKLSLENTQSKLIKSLGSTKMVFPIKVRPTFALTGMSDTSTKYGSSDDLSEWSMATTIQYEIEIPTFIIVKTDYLVENIELNYSVNTIVPKNNNFLSEENNGKKQLIQTIMTKWDSGLVSGTNGEYGPPSAAEVEYIDYEYLNKYFHIVTSEEKDSTYFTIDISSLKLDNQNAIQIQAPGKTLDYGVDFEILFSENLIKITNVDILKTDDILEILVYQKFSND